eukprot:TRINITY_DN3294_c0_g1_i2.p1 TRINITY_DN3294_c0_g1~~TRINITY_DN3294_c0_g1_i2.p1  ORF type:complete len:170 (+),score=69.16 TRINITY_DN3294_c0_g1_i2:412-921(+)
MQSLNAVASEFQVLSRAALEKMNTPLPVQQKQEAYNPFAADEDDSHAEDQSLMESERREQLRQIEEQRKFNDSLITEREEGIKMLETKVLEVNDIFRDLSTLVQEQGVMIDNIESNIEVSLERTTKGVGELEQAQKYAKKSTKKLWCLLILALGFLVVAIIIVIPAVLL